MTKSVEPRIPSRTVRVGRGGTQFRQGIEFEGGRTFPSHLRNKKEVKTNGELVGAFTRLIGCIKVDDLYQVAGDKFISCYTRIEHKIEHVVNIKGGFSV